MKHKQTMSRFKNKFSFKSKIFRPITLIYVSVFVLVLILIVLNLLESKDLQKKTESEQTKTDYFENLPVIAKAVYIYDSKENKVIFEKNAHTPLALASITKLMSVHCALKTLNENFYIQTPDKVWAYNDKATSTGATELWKVRDLAIYTLITSSNTGATVLSDYAGGEEDTLRCMNNEAQKMNLFETSFSNVTGLDLDDKTPGSRGSAENVAAMLQNIYSANNDVMNKTTFENYNIYSKNGTIHKAENTNIVADKIVGFLGSKTGLTDIAGGNIAFAMDVGLNHKIFVAILGSTEEGRFKDALTLSDAVIKSFAN